MSKPLLKIKKIRNIAGLFVGALLLLFMIHSVALAASNIVSSPFSSRWAWNDIAGWIDFRGTNTVNVLSQGLTGYASSSIGFVSLDCATSPSGNVCGESNYRVINDGAGNLSGWAWNDAVGWISFCGGQEEEDCPGAGISYRVLINNDTGDLSGWAWNDAVGWISFNCVDAGLCGASSYKVATDWTATSTMGYLDSFTFDTGLAGGAKINSVIWQGSLPSPANGAFVGFQFAVSEDSGGPWDYKGPDGTSSTYYESLAGQSASVDYLLHGSYRYFRYRLTLQSNETQTSSPLVESVSVNWSR